MDKYWSKQFFEIKKNFLCSKSALSKLILLMLLFHSSPLSSLLIPNSLLKNDIKIKLKKNCRHSSFKIFHTVSLDNLTLLATTRLIDQKLSKI